MNFASAGGAHHVDEAAGGGAANDGVVDHYHALIAQDFTNRIVLDLHLGVAASLRWLKEGAPNVMVTNQRELER